MSNYIEDIQKAISGINEASREEAVSRLITLAFTLGERRDHLAKTLQGVRRNYEHVLDVLAKDSGIHCIVWQQDCDLYESTAAHRFDSYDDYTSFVDCLQDNAEGPYSLSIVSKEEYEDFSPSFRDRIMEAFENGNGTRVIV